MRIPWALAAAAAAVLAATAANAQTSTHQRKVIVDPEEGLPGYKRKYLPPDGYVPPEARLLVTLSAPPDSNVLAALAVLPPPLPTVVMLGGKGGSIQEHIGRFWTLARSGAAVEMRGGCFSACTLITAHIPKDKLCFAPGSFLAFHAATWTQTPPHQISPAATLQMYQSYPAEIRHWIDRHGGYEKLNVEAYWTMYDRDLWAAGYAKCQ